MLKDYILLSSIYKNNEQTVKMFNGMIAAWAEIAHFGQFFVFFLHLNLEYIFNTQCVNINMA